MQQSRQIKRNLDQVVRTVNVVRDRLPAALAAIVAELDHIDGYPGSASGADRQPGGSSELTSVESAVERRLGLGRRLGGSARLDAIQAHLAMAMGQLAEVLVLVDGARPVERGTYERHRCVGDTGEPHSHLWARPECENIAEADRTHGLCTTCRQRRAGTLRELEHTP